MLPILFSACFALTATDLTTSEKIGQVLMAHFNGEEPNKEAQTLIQELYIGGIIYYNWSNGLHNPSQVANLSKGLQEYTLSNKNPIPLFISTDQEGGLVTRLTNGFTLFPGNKALGMTQDPSLAAKQAFIMGSEMRQVGINLNLAPVADINSNPQNPVIGIRSFGETAEVVTIFCESSLRGYHQAGIATCLKHFPGHGDVGIDSHEDLPVLHKTLDQLKKTELVPFTKLAKETDAIMTAHILIPALDKKPATLSFPILKLLREDLGFEGVIMADSLIMEGLLKLCPSIEEAALTALNAGCDMLILGGKHLIGSKAGSELTLSDIQKIHHYLVKATEEGMISEEKLNDSVNRILVLKNRYANFPNTETPLSLQESNTLSLLIAKKALNRIRQRPLPSLQKTQVAVLAPIPLTTPLSQSRFNTLSPEFFNLNPSIFEQETLLKKITDKELLILFSYNACSNPDQKNFIDKLLLLGKEVVVIAVRNPLDGDLFPTAQNLWITYSPTTPSLEAVYDCFEWEGS